ncbi:MAG TPA: hypothetical protein VK856_02855 [Anaerolineaceae bacterium]|nr:hypothetical protein [Anaerolineaceae bacterium]
MQTKENKKPPMAGVGLIFGVAIGGGLGIILDLAIGGAEGILLYSLPIGAGIGAGLGIVFGAMIDRYKNQKAK